MLAGLALFSACGPGAPALAPAHSSSIAISADGAKLYVVNADADSISILDARARTLTGEVLLAEARPAPAADGTYAPSVRPRALALSIDQATLFVTGERSSRVYAITLANFKVRASEPIGSEPIGIVTSSDGRALYVACSQDAKVVKLNATSLALEATAPVPANPWSLAWSADALLVTHLLGPGVTVLDASTMKVRETWTIPDVAARGDKRLAHGQARALYDAVVRPGTAETWVAHTMLASDTAQPDLDFESTAFPTLTVFNARGKPAQTLSTDALDVSGLDGVISDIVSGPRALAFTADGNHLLMLDAASEDVLLIDAKTRAQAGLLRPLPGDFPEGLVLSPDGAFAYVDERGTSDVAVVKLTRTADALSLSVDGPAISRVTADPMPAQLRLGQHLFYSANSDEQPITTNHWLACAGCHPEGRVDAVTWRFLEGPRDTPTTAGGTRGTGFLSRTADRNRVQDYWRTINLEQGGAFDPADPALVPMLDALAAFVDFAIPVPIPPTTNAERAAKGKAIFERADVGCATCHPGPRLTDSGQGNPTLSLSGPILRHDVGTCAKGDVDHLDVEGHPREACLLDTPSLRGLASTAPYLHDGSAPTLRDMLEKTRGKMGDISSLSADDLDALIEYLSSL